MSASGHESAQAFLENMPGVDRLEESPIWPLSMAFDSKTWSHAPLEELPIDSLHRTQRRVYKKYLGGNGADPTEPGREHPWVVEVRGQNWLAGSHHRTADAAMAGQNRITAYTRRQPERSPDAGINLEP